MLSRKTTITLCVALMTVSMGYSQSPDKESKGSVFDWFYAPDNVLEVELQTNLDSLALQKMTNNEIDGVITFMSENGEQRALPAKLRARGRFRRKICEFPPVKIDFNKGVLKEYGLNKKDEYKLVTHCFNSKAGDVNVLKEFLVYRLYQKLTDKSFRVQLLKIKYLNERGKKQTTAYGFIIENEDEIADRMHSELRERRYNVAPDSLLQSNIHCHDLFQYMVCNTDWNLAMTRNMKLFWEPQDEHFFVIPYDFDFSGLVNAAYALPNADLRQRNIRERHYMGIADSMEQLTEPLAIFRSQRNDLLQYIKNFKLLKGRDRRDMMKYLDSFYKGLDNGTFQADLAK